MSSNLTRASYEWVNRPDDERFLTLEDLATAVGQRKVESWTRTEQTANLRVIPHNGQLVVTTAKAQERGASGGVSPSHWAFGQLAQYAQAPASYLRQLPAELAAVNLQWGLEKRPIRPETLVLGQSNGRHVLRSLTSPSYGRIWDSQVVQAVQRVNAECGGRWVIPAASYATQNPKRATTLYASDRDVFIFLVDPENVVEVGNEKLFRGFFMWNSEVGAATFGLTTFLYRYVCDNRIVWGASDVRELRIRHTGGAPDRFEHEGAQYLARYANESTLKLAEGVRRAQELKIPLKKDETVAEWLQSRGFSKGQAVDAVKAATAEEGEARTLWQIVNGVTAAARAVVHTDARIELETKAGRLMELVAA